MSAEPPVPRAIVSAVIRDGAGRILLVRRRDDGLWCCPGGHVDFGETVTEALHREVREEAGVAVTMRRLVGVYSVFGERAPAPGRHFVALSFLCDLASGEPRPGGDELEARFFPHEELPPLRSNHRERIDDALGGRDGVVVA